MSARDREGGGSGGPVGGKEVPRIVVSFIGKDVSAREGGAPLSSTARCAKTASSSSRICFLAFPISAVVSARGGWETFVSGAETIKHSIVASWPIQSGGDECPKT